MVRSRGHRVVIQAVLSVSLLFLLAACRSQGGEVQSPTSSAFGPTPAPSAQQAYPSLPAATAAPTKPGPATLVPAQADVAFTLTILHTGEVYGEVRPCGWGVPQGGVARRATVISQWRQKEQGAVLVLDSGNSLFASKPSATADPSQGALPVEAMNVIGYDAMALGERDVASGASFVGVRFQEAAFPILSANVGPVGTLPNLQPYLLREVQGQVVAIIGVTNGTVAQYADALGANLTVEDTVEAVRNAVEQVRDQAGIIVVLSNLSQQENMTLAQQIPGLDAIIGGAGGSPVQVQSIAGPEGQVVLHASGIQGKGVGVLTLQFDAQGRVVAFSGKVESLVPQVADDPELVRVMDKYGVKP